MQSINLSKPGGRPPESIYDLIGNDGFTRLVAAFYAQVPDDSILGPMYDGIDLEGAEKRLRDFLIFRFGGPTTYIEERGHPRLRMRHMPFRIDQAARDRWIELMDHAFDQAQLPAEAEHVLRQFFAQVSTFMINSQEDPDQPAADPAKAPPCPHAGPSQPQPQPHQQPRSMDRARQSQSQNDQ